MLLKADHGLSDSLILLLTTVSGVDTQLLEQTRVVPHTANWLRFPWYPASRGGAFVLGSRIYLKSRSLQGAYQTNGPEHMTSLLLLAHEVGHLPQAQRFGQSGFGKFTFLCWAAGQYAYSALRNGPIKAHDHAPLEREADEGRWVLLELLKATANEYHKHVVTSILARDDTDRMAAWLTQHSKLITDLRTTYQAKYLGLRLQH